MTGGRGGAYEDGARPSSRLARVVDEHISVVQVDDWLDLRRRASAPRRRVVVPHDGAEPAGAARELRVAHIGGEVAVLA